MRDICLNRIVKKMSERSDLIIYLIYIMNIKENKRAYKIK